MLLGSPDGPCRMIIATEGLNKGRNKNIEVLIHKQKILKQ
jgi:hypothetical protein